MIDDDEMTRISIDKRWAQVTLSLSDGRRIKDAPRSARGDADMPLSDQQMADKFHLLADPMLGHARANEIEDLSARLDSLSSTDLTRLIDLCTQSRPRVTS